MMCFLKKIIQVALSSVLILGSSGISYAAETACNNNGGAGWPINDGSLTNISIPFFFGDVSVAYDINISTDITHTYIGDLTAKVTHPDTVTTVRLFERPGTTGGDTAADIPPVLTQPAGGWGCSGNNIVVTFDDEAVPANSIENACPPTTNGTYRTHDLAPKLTAFDNKDPSGNWNFYLSDSANGDSGVLNQACITASFAGVTFDEWVSSDASCLDTIDAIAVAPGTNVYFCYTVINPGTEAFTISGATNDLGHNLSPLEGITYNPKGSVGDSKTIAIGPIVAGSAGLPVGTTTNNASVIANFSTSNFTGTLPTSETATAIVANPIINTSTKTVVDVNGGAPEAGDVLEYTISIIETAGIYTPNAQVTDVVDASLNSVTFTTLPPGAINNTVGNNIDISGITLPANGTVTIVYTANIGALLAVGTNIDNTATISHANSGITFDAAATTVVVGDTPIVPANGVKQLYFDNLDTANPDLTRDPTNALTDTSTGTLSSGTTFSIEQAIVFESPFTLTGGNNVVVQVLARRRNTSGARTIKAELYNTNGGGLIGVANSTSSWNANGWQTITVPINIPADVTLSTGDAIRLELTTTGGNVQLRTINGADKAKLQIQSSTVINVDSVAVYAAAYPSSLQFSSYDPINTVYIRAVISDPFGSADVTSAILTITDAAAVTPINNAAMPLPAATTALSKTFEYAYDITSAPAPVGFWDISVTGKEGYETTPLISHTANTRMIVGLPNLTIIKSSQVKSDPINSSNYKALPGAIIEYTISVNNSGYGYVDDDKFVITDSVPSGTTLFFGQNPPVPFMLDPVDFVDGADASGLTFSLNTGNLGDPLDDVEFYNTGGTNLVTPTYDANGYDTTSPPIDLIRINPKGEFRGSNGTTIPSLQLKFRIKVE